MHALSDCASPSRAGFKVARQAQALAAGLPVPNGVVFLPDDPIATPEAILQFFAQLSPDPFATEPCWVVRSSALDEDQDGQSCAGLFLSERNVTAANLPAAILRVRQSGSTELLRAALGKTAQVSVLLQRQVSSVRLGVLYRNQHGRIRTEERETQAPEWADVQVGQFSGLERHPLCTGVSVLATLFPQPSTGCTPLYVEYAVTPRETIVFLQARPAPPERDAGPFTLEDDRDAVYYLDQEHNPDPLSCAQQGLVSAVAGTDSRAKQRVLDGYLYFAQTPGSPPPQPLPLPLTDLFLNTLLPACEQEMAPFERQLLGQDGALLPKLCENADAALDLGPDLGLPSVVAVYRRVYQKYVEVLRPHIRRARDQVDAFLRNQLGETLEQHGDLIAGIGGAQTERLAALWALGCTPSQTALRRFLARFGAFCTAWDVAYACDDEQPDHVLGLAQHMAKQTETPKAQHEAALARYHGAQRHVLTRLSGPARAVFLQLLPRLREALFVAEEDDLLFFRAQRLVRWALLARGQKLLRARRLRNRTQCFDLPWQTKPGGPTDFEFPETTDLDELAQKHHAERLQARHLVPPQRIERGQPVWSLPSQTQAQGPHLQGVTIRTGARVVIGTALVVPHLTEPESGFGPGSQQVLAQLLPRLTRDTVLVLPTLLPSWAPVVAGVLAVVTDSGGALCHGAILARERGVLAVLGTRFATQKIVSGQTVLIDGERGVIVAFFR